MPPGKLIIVTAPSGAGKTTIVKHLLKAVPELAFSISATTRELRYGEVNGMDYYFISLKDFEKKIKHEEFLEYQEVYENQFYGTLKSEIERLWKMGKTVLFDIDVKGARNIKKAYPDNSLAIFIKPPSKDVLFERLRNRRTEDEDSLRKRMARAAEELTYEDKFDVVIVNDVLERAQQEAIDLVKAFI